MRLPRFLPHTFPPPSVPGSLRRAVLDLVLPEECAACHRAGSAWCARCAEALTRIGLASGPSRVVPDPPPPGLPTTVAWGLYDDPLRAAITAWKDEGRRDLQALFAPLLGAAVEVACAAAAWRGPVLVVPAPSSRHSTRVRGDTPLTDLAAAVVAAPARSRVQAPGSRVHLHLAPALRPARAIADQAGLGTQSRAANLRRAHEVDPRWRDVVRARRVVVVDDVMTTGSTLSECARALAEAGAREVRAATIAVARRRPIG